MTDQNPNDTGVWAPPAAEPSWFAPARRIPHPDARVPLQRGQGAHTEELEQDRT